jgi:hypothetical protein
VIVDQLYSRLVYSGQTYTHLRAASIPGAQVVTIMGPSKTESLSGYRLGVAFGSARLVDRMEKLQAIVSLSAPGYSQAVLRTWFADPDGWLEDRTARHQAIRAGRSPGRRGQASSNTASTSTGMSSGSEPMPTALRTPMPCSTPQISANSSLQPLIT